MGRFPLLCAPGGMVLPLWSQTFPKVMALPSARPLGSLVLHAVLGSGWPLMLGQAQGGQGCDTKHGLPWSQGDGEGTRMGCGRQARVMGVVGHSPIPSLGSVLGFSWVEIAHGHLDFSSAAA